jgi:hypothetical protein
MSLEAPAAIIDSIFFSFEKREGGIFPREKSISLYIYEL